MFNLRPKSVAAWSRWPSKTMLSCIKGTCCLQLIPRQYEYALQQALADQQLLEAQITDAQRTNASENSAVEAARAGLSGSQTQTKVSESSVDAALAAVERAKAALEVRRGPEGARREQLAAH